MEFRHIGPIGIRANNAVTIPWGREGASLEHPQEAAVAGAVIKATEDIFDRHKADDNRFDSGSSSPDLDASLGRVLKKSATPLHADGLLGGESMITTSCRYDTDSEQREALDITSENKNCSVQATWENGALSSAVHERVLEDGSLERVSVQVNSSEGTLTLIQTHGSKDIQEAINGVVSGKVKVDSGLVSLAHQLFPDEPEKPKDDIQEAINGVVSGKVKVDSGLVSLAHQLFPD